MAYTKLFQSILDSTIWGEQDTVRIVWITLLAMADKNGEVLASIPGLARRACVPVADVEKALFKFQSPDKYSRTPDDEGRRIEAIDGGWLLLNYQKYRLLASKEDEKAKTAERVRRHRARKKRNELETQCNESETDHNDSITQDRDIAEAEAEAEVKGTSLSNSGTVPTYEPSTETDSKPPSGVEREREVGSDGNIPTWDEVWTEAQMRAIPHETAKSFFDWHEGKKYWLNAHGRLINWRHVLRTWKVKGQQLTQSGTSSSASLPPQVEY